MSSAFLGERFRLARLLNLMTQAEVAIAVGVTRQFIHALEIGDKTPSRDLQLALSLTLKVSPGFFSSPNMMEVKEEQCHFRSRKTTALANRHQFMAHGTLFNALVKHLERDLGLPAVDIPHIDVSVGEDIDEAIEDAAEGCRKYWELGDGPITNMCRVLEKKAGAVITQFPGISEKVDALSVSTLRPIVVTNPDERSPARQRFSLAHECGHLVMHFGIETGDEITEAQANRFASAFLLPRRTFTLDFPIGGRFEWARLYEMKRTWGVSVSAIVRRARDLGLIDETQYYRGNAYLSKSGQRKKELYDDLVPEEYPTLLKTALSVYKEGIERKPFSIADELQVSPILLKQLLGDDVEWMKKGPSDNAVVNINEYKEKRSVS